MSWVGQDMQIYNKNSVDGGYCFCRVGVVEHEGRRFEQHGQRVGAERICLNTELGERVVELFRDTETGGGRILLYGRDGDVIWQAPEPQPAVGVEADHDIQPVPNHLDGGPPEGG